MKFTKSMKSDELQDHIFATYANLRIGVAVIAIVFPLLLWAGGAIQGISLQDSMSAYYHANSNLDMTPNDGVMRSWFVGILFTVGVILYLYKGYSHLENLALNFAGILALGIAIFPMEWTCNREVFELQCQSLSMHGTCAVLFFICIGYVCIWRASDTLREMENEAREKRYRRFYQLIGSSMVLAILVAMSLSIWGGISSLVFFAEAVGVWIFAVYWLLKSREIALTNAERLAFQKRLKHNLNVK